MTKKIILKNIIPVEKMVKHKEPACYRYARERAQRLAGDCGAVNANVPPQEKTPQNEYAGVELKAMLARMAAENRSRLKPQKLLKTWHDDY